MRYLLASLLGLCLFSGCPSTGNGDRLFDITYEPIDFVVPAGQVSPQLFVVSRANMITRFIPTLDASAFTADDVDQVGGIRARVVSLSGEDFREIDRVELRVCPTSERQCSVADIMYSVDHQGRRQQVINLNPGLRNFRSLYLQDETVRMEVVFYPLGVTSQNIETRLEWTIGAIGGL
ncbi:hypothetical protein LEM8419_02198 [Neolewinella maritima]|uniref:Uncharacterized protein n=1 Tax=Neolewinella maritima TaxID=1383882 RepID=A0ABM9B1U3_9BACT|nr:hypothetical protein [Neolewinella maritima]CAH1001297.1 hypothetical protein LEM8419_02198 [Neolewinella maritima]